MSPRFNIYLVLMFVMLQQFGCRPAAKPTRTVKAVTKRTPIEFTFPEDWKPTPNKHPFDLQWQDVREEMNTCVFVYRKQELPVGVTVADFYESKVDELREKRANVQVVKPVQKQEGDGKKLTTTVFQGEKDGQKYYYCITLIEFLGADSKLAIVLQSCLPDHWKDNELVLAKIAYSARASAEMP